MKQVLRVVVLLVVAAFLAAVGYAGEKSKMDVKVGDELYVCSCGEKCPCETLSRTEGKCPCGVDLVKAKATVVEESKAKFMVGDKERTFNTVGKYACACGPTCPCNTISQRPGKCSCGVDLKPVS